MKNNKNIVITERDLEILKLINRVIIIKWSVIYKIISPDKEFTDEKEKIFKYRLKKLRQHWFIDIVNNDTWIVWENIYRFNYKKENLERIKDFIWEEININRSLSVNHSLFYHTLGISSWILYIKKLIQEKKWIHIKSDNIIWENEVKKIIEKEWRSIYSTYQNQEKHMIPDSIVNVWNVSFCIEIELKSAENLQKIETKLNWYKNMQFYLWNNNFSKVLKEKIFLFIFTNKINLHKYEKIIKDIKLNEVDNIKVKLIALEDIKEWKKKKV